MSTVIRFAQFPPSHGIITYLTGVQSSKVRFVKNLSRRSAIRRNFGALKSNLPALTPQEEHEVAEQAIAEDAIRRMGS
jgi:hypothetical protein